MTKVPIDFVTVSCFDCGAPYLVMENMEGTDHCPYCSHEKMYALLYEERIKNNSIYDEITKLKRSNAALKGVITKMRGGTMTSPVNKVGKDVVEEEQYEVDLCDLVNYDILTVDNKSSSCDYACNHCDLGHSSYDLCKLIGHDCSKKITTYGYYKLKPEIKAALESGKAVAKGGK